MLDVALLGTGGMMPLPNRFLTSLMCRLNGKLLLIDCGEGTQVTMKMLGWGFKNIDTICFTHYHADHISGLAGLLLTIGNSARTEPLNLVGPIGLEYIVKNLCIIAPELPFKLKFHELEKNTTYSFAGYNISTTKLEHWIPCLGYSINIKRVGEFNLAKAKELNIPIKLWNKLQKGEIIEENGKKYFPEMVLGENRKGIKLSYCTDSRPTEGLSEFIYDSDLFICEGMYGENEKLQKAIEHKHMLFSEAATIAKNGNVKELWLTHFSPALTNPEDFINNARNIFPNTLVAKDRMTKTILFD